MPSKWFIEISAKSADPFRIVDVENFADFQSLLERAKQITPETKATKHIRISLAAEADQQQHAQIRDLGFRSTD